MLRRAQGHPTVGSRASPPARPLLSATGGVETRMGLGGMWRRSSKAPSQVYGLTTPMLFNVNIPDPLREAEIYSRRTTDDNGGSCRSEYNS